MFAINIEIKKKSHIFKKNIKPFYCLQWLVYSKCSHEYEKLFKEEESTEILKVVGLINNIEEYQKVYSHA